MEKLRGKVILDYDRENDVLYSYINKPRYAVGVDVSNGVTLRVDPKKKQIVGFTVVDFKYKIMHGIVKKIPHFENINVRDLVKT
jgi:Protein of unknown function (DUF2283)